MPIDENYPLALPTGTILAGQYTIEKVLGQGGFGITYLANDHRSGSKVAVKEFFPDTLAYREHTKVISYPGERSENFEYGKESFLQEAKTLAEFIGCANIVRIHSYFEENGTAYFIMDYIEGIAFDSYLKSKGGKISFAEAKSILVPVIEALAVVHSKGIVHRDVTPDNIYITNDGTVKLLDFGAARYSLGDKSRSLDVILKHGFAPKEQYTRRGRQGPFTDVYSLGATLYFAVTGRRPPDSIDRLEDDELILPSSLGVSLSEDEEKAMLRAMEVQPADRFQSMTEFRNALCGAAASNPVTVSIGSFTQQQSAPVQHTAPVQPVSPVSEQPKVNTQTPPVISQPEVGGQWSLTGKSGGKKKEDSGQSDGGQPVQRSAAPAAAEVIPSSSGGGGTVAAPKSDKKVFILVAVILAVVIGLIVLLVSLIGKDNDDSVKSTSGGGNSLELDDDVEEPRTTAKFPLDDITVPTTDGFFVTQAVTTQAAVVTTKPAVTTAASSGSSSTGFSLIANCSPNNVLNDSIYAYDSKNGVEYFVMGTDYNTLKKKTNGSNVETIYSNSSKSYTNLICDPDKKKLYFLFGTTAYVLDYDSKGAKVMSELSGYTVYYLYVANSYIYACYDDNGTYTIGCFKRGGTEKTPVQKRPLKKGADVTFFNGYLYYTGTSNTGKNGLFRIPLSSISGDSKGISYDTSSVERLVVDSSKIYASFFDSNNKNYLVQYSPSLTTSDTIKTFNLQYVAQACGIDAAKLTISEYNIYKGYIAMAVSGDNKAFLVAAKVSDTGISDMKIVESVVCSGLTIVDKSGVPTLNYIKASDGNNYYYKFS